MESDDLTPPVGASSKKVYIGIGILIVAVLSIVFITRGNTTTSNSEEIKSDQRIDELLALDKKISNEIGVVTRDTVSTVLADGKRYMELYEDLKNAQIRTAKRLDMDDAEAMKAFVADYDTLKKVETGTEDCSGFAFMIRSMLSDRDITDSQKDNLHDLALETCELVNELDIIKLSRSSEVINVNDEYVEVESSAIPVGQSFVAIKPENGKKDIITITVDGESPKTSEVVTKEPVIGKKVTGVGDSATIVASVQPVLANLLSDWKEGLTAATIINYLKESEKDEATDIESRYNQIAFNWMRTEGLELIPSQATFESGTNSEFPFAMMIPIIAPYVDQKWDSKIVFYYYPETDSWGAGSATFAWIFRFIDLQNIPATYDPEVVVYDESPTCQDTRSFNRAEGVKILSMGLSGKNKFNLKPENGVPDQLLITVPGSDTQVELTGGGWYREFNDEFPPQLIELINNAKSPSITIDEFNSKNKSQSGIECLADTDVLVTFFAGE